MPFKIKDLMINIAGGEKADEAGCTGKRTDIDQCTGKRTDVDQCTGKRTDVGCTGKRTDMGCTGKRTDAAMCLGTAIEHLLNAAAASAQCARPDFPAPACARCTLKSHQVFSFRCDAREMLEDLNAIKAELQAELAAVDEEIREVEDTLQPKTVAEVEELQTKLQEALDELGKIKADLEKK